MKTANRDDFWKLKQRRFKTIDAGGVFGDEIGTVCIRSLTEGERGQIMSAIIQGKTTGSNAALLIEERAWVVVMSVCDADGNRLFTDAEVEDVKLMDGAVVQWLYDEIDKHCQVSAFREAERIEEIAKNSPTTEGDVLQSV